MAWVDSNVYIGPIPNPNQAPVWKVQELQLHKFCTVNVWHTATSNN